MNVISGDEASVEILDLNEVCSEDSIYVASTNRKKLSLPRQLKISNQHFFLNLSKMKNLLNGNTAFW